MLVLVLGLVLLVAMVLCATGHSLAAAKLPLPLPSPPLPPPSSLLLPQSRAGGGWDTVWPPLLAGHGWPPAAAAPSATAPLPVLNPAPGAEDAADSPGVYCCTEG